MNNQSNLSSEKVAEALELLNEAAKEKKEEVRDIISMKYKDLKESIFGSEIKHSLGTAKKNAVEAAAKARNLGEEKVKVLATQMDQNVHSNPWPYIGGASIVALLLGYILGKKN